ncbi:hypothetical protein DSM104443_03482 [Usitatibacter rugosus]|uniref:Uncharacterized protein n=1 Tax=Usitatibacter rugosus TaxID=2732067 RepID=A0A6M4GYT4_9PROT|nr:hypothetical protein [Usitatibacter rugosus]QJR12396.1 hypothetical protein DSM104443_03482 [Usitatibacter rugosus]
MKHQLLIALPAALLAASAFAGQYDQPYSIIATEYKLAADPLERKVTVNRVDDVNSRNNESVVGPGKHSVVVDLPPRKGFSLGTQKIFDLETKPCTRYFVVAKLENQVTQDWTPAVKYEEEIKECSARFLKGGKT